MQLEATKRSYAALGFKNRFALDFYLHGGTEKAGPIFRRAALIFEPSA
jgi:hypothetical protein